jgi:uridine kinase
LPRPHIILIDGEAGAGKTTLANLMSAALGATVVHLDDAYPGWSGLVAGRDAVIASVLESARQGDTASYVAWDWEGNRPGRSITVEPRDVLIVEGCGISTARSRALAEVSIWLDCPEPRRLERIHQRDGASFDEHWAEWNEQVSRHITENDPIASATVRLST